MLFGYAMTHLGAVGQSVHTFIEECSRIFFAMMNAIMKLAPLGAGGAMAFTIGNYGLGALKPLAALMAQLLPHVPAVHLRRARHDRRAACGFNIFRFIVYIRDELLTVLGTSSSESALVPLMHKLERLGCSKSVVGLVVPAGYSFNLDGTNIYLTMAAMFVAQALNIELTLTQQMTLLRRGDADLEGRVGRDRRRLHHAGGDAGGRAVGAGGGLALILGIDRFMSEARSLTNFIGNGVATLVVSRWERELDRHGAQARAVGRTRRIDRSLAHLRW